MSNWISLAPVYSDASEKIRYSTSCSILSTHWMLMKCYQSLRFTISSHKSKCSCIIQLVDWYHVTLTLTPTELWTPQLSKISISILSWTRRLDTVMDQPRHNNPNVRCDAFGNSSVSITEVASCCIDQSVLWGLKTSICYYCSFLVFGHFYNCTTNLINN